MAVFQRGLPNYGNIFHKIGVSYQNARFQILSQSEAAQWKPGHTDQKAYSAVRHGSKSLVKLEPLHDSQQPWKAT